MIYQRGKVIYQLEDISYVFPELARDACKVSILWSKGFITMEARSTEWANCFNFFGVTSQMKLTKRKCICHQALKIALFLLMFLGQLFIDVSIHPSQKSWKIRYEISKNVIISFTEMSFERYIKIGWQLAMTSAMMTKLLFYFSLLTLERLRDISFLFMVFMSLD